MMVWLLLFWRRQLGQIELIVARLGLLWARPNLLCGRQKKYTVIRWFAA